MGAFIFMKPIQLTQGQITLVDDDDYIRFGHLKWHILKGRNTNYAVHNIILPNGKQGLMLLHREIMNAKKGDMVDHKDRNGLNNQKDNLRFCNQSQNSANMVSSWGTSKYLGVFKATHIKNGKEYSYWKAKINSNGIVYRLGSFPTEKDAAIGYNKKAIELHGEFANLNIISD